METRLQALASQSPTSALSREQLVEWAAELGLGEDALRLSRRRLYDLLRQHADMERFERRQRRHRRRQEAMQPVEEPAEEVKEDEEGASRQIRRSPRLRRDAASAEATPLRSYHLRKRKRVELEEAEDPSPSRTPSRARTRPRSNRKSPTKSKSKSKSKPKTTKRKSKPQGKAKKRSRASAKAKATSSPRKKRRTTVGSGRTKKKRKPEEIDPITRAPLGKHVFEFYRPNGSKVRYDARTLAEYILSTGDFLEPVSRVRFSEKDLQRLDYTVKCAGFKLASVCEAFQHPERYDEKAIARNALLGLERCIGEIVHEMLSLIDAVNAMNADPESAESNLVGNMFPVFSHYLDLLKGMDASYANQCLEQYITFVNGPPNKPTSNFMGFREHVIRFFEHLKG